MGAWIIGLLFRSSRAELVKISSAAQAARVSDLKSSSSSQYTYSSCSLSYNKLQLCNSILHWLSKHNTNMWTLISRWIRFCITNTSITKVKYRHLMCKAYNLYLSQYQYDSPRRKRQTPDSNPPLTPGVLSVSELIASIAHFLVCCPSIHCKLEESLHKENGYHLQLHPKQN